MVELTRKSAERVARVVRTVEQHFVSLAPDGKAMLGDQQPRLFKLTTTISASTHLASANPMEWSASAGSGAGALAADTGTTVTLRDVTEVLYGLVGEIVECRPIGAEDGTVWMITGFVSQQAPWIEFAVNYGSGFADTDSSVTVDSVVYHSGHEPPTGITTVYNKSADATDYIFAGADNAEGEALLDRATGHYIICQMECQP